MRAVDGHRACSAIGLSLLLGGGAAFATEHDGQTPPQLPFELPPLSSPGVAADAGASDLTAALVRVDQIHFRGSRAQSASVLQAAAAPYLGRDLNPAEIEELRTALTHLYTDRGYINSGVVLDPQAPWRSRDGSSRYASTGRKGCAPPT